MSEEAANAQCKETMVSVNEMIKKVSAFPRPKKYLSLSIGCGSDAFFSDVLFKKNKYYIISRTLILSIFCP
jgi:hypothetical protein